MPFDDFCAIGACPSDPVAVTRVQLRCGHSFCLGCIGRHVHTKCEEAKAHVADELRASDADANSAGDSQSFVTLHAQGRIRCCPRLKCGYGPVINLQCNDLAAHDCLRGRGTDRTSNSCPMCGFFSSSWTDWAEWRPTNPTVAARCPVCRGSCCPLDKDTASLEELSSELDKSLEPWDGLETLQFRVADAVSQAVSVLQRDLAADGQDAEVVSVRPSQTSCLLTGPFMDLLTRRIELERPAYLRAIQLDFEEPREVSGKIVEMVRAADHMEVDSEHARLSEKRHHVRLLLQAGGQKDSSVKARASDDEGINPGRPVQRQRGFSEFSVSDFMEDPLGRSREETSCFSGVICLVCPRCSPRSRRSVERPRLGRARSFSSPSQASDWIPPEVLTSSASASLELGSRLRGVIGQLQMLQMQTPPLRSTLKS